MAFVQVGDHWSMENVYTTENFPLPSMQHVGITQQITVGCLTPPFAYTYKLARIELLKIQIPLKSFKVCGE